MKESRFTEAQIIGILKQHEAGVKTADLCREHVIPTRILYDSTKIAVAKILGGKEIWLNSLNGLRRDSAGNRMFTTLRGWDRCKSMSLSSPP